ncbi:phage tail terminator protein [Paracoccus lutimaris]|uniref:Gp37 protein n=1 Tax=Paracoccus lutimaris TaxID=1490030 RepID=A0A368YI10_9RHOB|nr:hypothetical protein [Paracoccus lutimaris]RCW77814.1 hypothetical protein DFP89_1568 [Paracoccus lutimaris]
MLTAIVTRLRSELLPAETPDVVLVEDIDELSNYAGQVESGSVIVVPFREQASAQSLATGGHRQRVALQFLTGVVIRHYDNLMGAERAVQFDGHVRRIEAALAGWEPAGAISPCALVSGESSPIEKGVSIYVQTWETARFLTGA